MRPCLRRCRTRCRAPSSATRKATSFSAICSIAASRPRPSTASRKASPSIRTACASIESFGDIVNWDFLPDNAIDGISIIGANPVFGLNAIGGAALIVMRDGFNFQGVEIDSRFGSFGRRQGSMAVGQRSGIWGAFVAGELIHDDGFRDFSSAEIRRMYADIGVKNDGVELHLNYTGADNNVGVTAAAPEQLLNLGWNRTFTSPQTTDNKLSMLSLNGSLKASPSLTFSGVGYYRWFQQKHVDGNISDAAPCDNNAGVLCIDGDSTEQLFGTGPGVNGDGSIPSTVGDLLGSLDRTSEDARSYGGSLQGVDTTRLFGLGNRFLVGASYDHGTVDYTASSELGVFAPLFVVDGLGITLTGPNDVAARNLTTQNDYVGVYFSDTLDLTTKLALTVGGRYNFARIKIEDNTGLAPELNGDSTYERFNPMAGLTYEISKGLTLYGSYAEANRAPTAAELACADKDNPCLIESFLTADPALKQVVSRTFELGVRGQLASWGNDERLQWSAGLFRTENQDDIITIADQTSGRGYFQNAGDTLRQGIEAGLQYQNRRWQAYANYAYIDATFRTANILASPNNPSDAAFDCAGGPGTPTVDGDPVCIQVSPGDRLPGIPRHRFKAGFDYRLTPKWKFGADLIAASDQIFFGDEGNDNAPLGGYAKVDLRTSYDVTDHIQIYGIVDNAFDAHYGLFGNFFNTGDANSAAEADPSTGGSFFTNARTITPAPPVAAYGGVKVRF